MKKRLNGKTAVVLVAIACCAASAGWPSRAGDQEKTRRRLPDHFAKLGLTDEQRATIYAVQDRYGARIERLERELAELKARRTSDIRRVLRHDQRKKLDRLEAEDQAKRPEPAPPVSPWGDIPEDPVTAPLPGDQ